MRSLELSHSKSKAHLFQWYIAKIRHACTSTQLLSLAEQAAKGGKRTEEKLFGDLDKNIKYGSGLSSLTLADVAKIEWAAIENALRRAFTPPVPATNEMLMNGRR